MMPTPTTRVATRRPEAVRLITNTFREIRSDDIPGEAAKVAYHGFMAMPSALMALFAIAGQFESQAFADWLTQQAQRAVPSSVVSGILRPFIQDVVLTSAPGPLSIGFLLVLLSTMQIFTRLMSTLNVVYDVEEDRGFVKQKAIAFGTMIAAISIFLIAAVVLLLGPELAKLVGLGGVERLTWTLARWPITFAFITTAFWIVYFLLPNRDQKGHAKTILKAATIAAALWVLASAVFRLYISNFSSYNQAYGFLGAFIILLLWLWVTGLVVLVGGELASEMEKGVDGGG